MNKIPVNLSTQVTHELWIKFGNQMNVQVYPYIESKLESLLWCKISNNIGDVRYVELKKQLKRDLDVK